LPAQAECQCPALWYRAWLEIHRVSGRIPSWRARSRCLLPGVSHACTQPAGDFSSNDPSCQASVIHLGLDTSHFITPRTWSESHLKRAIATAQSVNELLHSLGLQPGSDEAWTRVKANAIRLGLDLSRLESTSDISEPAAWRPDLRNLRQAATSLAACWFSLCGFNTAIRSSRQFMICWYRD